MLYPAVLYADDLQKRYMQTIFTDKFRFFHGYSNIEYYLPIHENAGKVLQFVSVVDNVVIGYMGCSVNRETNTAYNLEIINFERKNDVFTADLFDWFTSLFSKFGFSRVVWWVIVGNPVEHFYDRFVSNYGGRIVGVFKNEVRLYDGQLYDCKYYEVHKQDYLEKINELGVNGLTYRDFSRGFS
jgi:hypothetical protein